jgi:hypothetical protein
MAFKLVQNFEFKKAVYDYDRKTDVLDVSFGPPVPAVALQIEDWLAVRIQVDSPAFQGMTIVGFRKIFEKVNRYVEKELPKRMRKLESISLEVAYDDQNDTLIMRVVEKPSFWRGITERLEGSTRAIPSVFERFSSDPALSNVYVEKTLPSKKMVGLKILQFTTLGTASMEAFLGAMVDAIFDPTRTASEDNTHLIVNALIQSLDLAKFSKLVAG